MLPLQKFWEALTNAVWTKKYMYGYEVFSDWKVGSNTRWTTNIQAKEHIRKGKVLQIETNKILKISDFSTDAGLEDIKSNYAVVTYELNPENSNQTTLQITDDCAGDEKRHKESDKFWNTVLSKLKEVVEADKKA